MADTAFLQQQSERRVIFEGCVSHCLLRQAAATCCISCICAELLAVLTQNICHSMHKCFQPKFAVHKHISSSCIGITNTLSTARKDAKTPYVETSNTPARNAQHDSKIRKKRTENFMLSSDYNRRFLRQQPEAAKCDSSILTKGCDAEGTCHACHSKAGVLAARQYDERQGGP